MFFILQFQQCLHLMTLTPNSKPYPLIYHYHPGGSNQSNMRGVTSGAGTPYPSRAHKFTSVFSVLLNIQILLIIVYAFVSFFILVIVLSVLCLPHCIVCPMFTSLYCLSYVYLIVLSVLCLPHCIVCPMITSLYCLSYDYLIVLSVL